MPRRASLGLTQRSFLRRADPRTKLALCLAASAAVMLPVWPLAVFVACYAILIVAADLVRHALAAVRRIVVLLAGLCVIDCWWIGPEFAALITLRLVLLATAFSLLVATTTPDELRRGLERMHIPRRLAFTFATAFASLGLLEAEWHGIIEAQRARGIGSVAPGQTRWSVWRTHLAHLVSLGVPAIVLLAQRAWSLTEAAAARGVESPHRSGSLLRLTVLDHGLLAGTMGLLFALFVMR